MTRNKWFDVGYKACMDGKVCDAGKVGAEHRKEWMKGWKAGVKDLDKMAKTA